MGPILSRIDAARFAIYTLNMRLTIALAAALSLMSACSSSGGCGGGPDKKNDSGQMGGMSGGGSGRGNGTLGEAVSFQGMGKKSSVAPYAAAGAPQTVLCGGFSNLVMDCTKDPLFEEIRKKCCPTGQIEQCAAVPGGARLVARHCAPPAAAPAAAPAPAPAPAASTAAAPSPR